MKKIYLFCSAGMSTSMLASNMQSVANAHNLPIKVAAFSHNKLEEIIEKDTPDCILLGPQVKYMYEETVEQFGNTGIPIAVRRRSFQDCPGRLLLRHSVLLLFLLLLYND